MQRSRSVDEALLDESDVPSKMMKLNLEKERQAMPTAENHLSSLQLASQMYWDSSKARTLFGAQKEDVNMLVTINQKIEKLCAVNQKVDGYQTVIEGHDPRNMCTQFQIFELRQCCALLCMAYVNA